MNDEGPIQILALVKTIFHVLLRLRFTRFSDDGTKRYTERGRQSGSEIRHQIRLAHRRNARHPRRRGNGAPSIAQEVNCGIEQLVTESTLGLALGYKFTPYRLTPAREYSSLLCTQRDRNFRSAPAKRSLILSERRGIPLFLGLEHHFAVPHKPQRFQLRTPL